MVGSINHSQSEAAIQAQIRENFTDVSSSIGSLVLRRDISDTRQTHWLEPGAIIALESQLDRRTIEGLYAEPKDLPQYLVEAVSHITGVEIERLVGTSKKKDAIMARFLSMYILRNRAEMTYLQIGRHFGRDHTTVIHAVNRITEKLAAERGLLSGEVATLIREVESQISDRLQTAKYEERNYDSGNALLDAVAVTIDGMHSYPADKIKVLYAKALRIRDLDTLVLDRTNRVVTDELLQTYGELAFNLFNKLKANNL